MIVYSYYDYLPSWIGTGFLMCLGTGFGGIIMFLLKNERFTKYEEKKEFRDRPKDFKKYKGGRY